MPPIPPDLHLSWWLIALLWAAYTIVGEIIKRGVGVFLKRAPKASVQTWNKLTPIFKRHRLLLMPFLCFFFTSTPLICVTLMSGTPLLDAQHTAPLFAWAAVFASLGLHDARRWYEIYVDSLDRQKLGQSAMHFAPRGSFLKWPAWMDKEHIMITQILMMDMLPAEQVIFTVALRHVATEKLTVEESELWTVARIKAPAIMYRLEAAIERWDDARSG